MAKRIKIRIRKLKPSAVLKNFGIWPNATKARTKIALRARLASHWNKESMPMTKVAQEWRYIRSGKGRKQQ